ncbi:hypothetical protein BDV93DRAFT_515446 [Ceratobasidium sp. AG-I]|nr:hypothetical protein BDV93DRAFT_515446 [Ceratobasidium sp. AG-I]
MEVDEPAQPVQPPEDPPVAKRRCFCCGRKYGIRQLARHLQDFLARLDEEIAAGQVAGDDDDLGNDDLGNEDAGPDFAAMDVDHAGPGNAAVDIDDAAEAEGRAQGLDQGQYALN